MIARAAALCAALWVTGCGVVYTSPFVEAIAPGSEAAAQQGYTVDVLPLTPAVVAEANARMTPARSLPAAFDPTAIASSYRRTAVGGAGTAAALASTVPPGGRTGARPTRLPPQAAPTPYLIGVGDRISIGARDATAIGTAGRETFTVQDNGSIAIPGVGQIEVSGLPLDEARDRVLQAFVGRGLDANFSFEITDFLSQSVIVGGAVAQPAQIPITFRPLTLDRALQEAGGIEFDDLSDATVELSRDGAIYALPAQDALRSGLGAAVTLRDGDVVFVDVGLTEAQRQRAFAEALALRQLDADIARLRTETIRADAEAARFDADRSRILQDNFLRRLELGAEQRDFAYLAGEVDAPQRVPLPYEGKLSLADVLYPQTGRSIRIITGDMSQIYVIRSETEDATRLSAYHLDARNATKLALATRFEIQADDVVFVAEQPITAFNRVLTQLFPQITTFAVNQFAN